MVLKIVSALVVLMREENVVAEMSEMRKSGTDVMGARRNLHQMDSCHGTSSAGEGSRILCLELGTVAEV